MAGLNLKEKNVILRRQDERNQILTTNCWLTQMWNDSHLTWNSSDYGRLVPDY